MKIKNNNLNIARKYLEIAEKDLEASKILYDKGYYSFSIYHLQQSIEKLVKCYLLKIGMDKEDKEFKKYLYTHTPIDPHALKAISIYFSGYKYQNMNHSIHSRGIQKRDFSNCFFQPGSNDKTYFCTKWLYCTK